MKFRTILATAALFISAGFAFAKGRDFPDYMWTANETVGETTTKNVLNVTLIRFNGGSEGGFAYGVGGYTGTNYSRVAYGELKGADLKQLTDAEADALPLAGTNLTEKDIEEIKHFSKSHGVYQFSVVSEKPIDEFGLMGTNGNVLMSDNLVESITNIESNNNRYFEGLGNNDVLYFGKNKFKNGAVLLVSVSDAPIYEKVVTIGKPLPTPVVTLLIALGLGTAFAMYRKNKTAKA